MPDADRLGLPQVKPAPAKVKEDGSTIGRHFAAKRNAGPAAAPATELPTLAEGMELRGRWRYRLEGQLGKGGFGSVYLATCLNSTGPDAPPAQVALKFFNVPQAGNQHQLVRRELSALLAIKHDRIIRLFDWRVDRSPCFMALEYYPMGSLFDSGFFMGKPLSEKEIIRVMRDLLSALTVAHQASILHLDIKPSNVLKDMVGNNVLTDFGISQGVMVGHEVVTTGVGSLGYQSPEQREYDTARIGPRTDLWGVGATAWSLYTGLRLDTHKALIRTAASGAKCGLPAVSEFRPMRPELEAFIMTMLAIDPSQRSGGAAEALALLDEMLNPVNPNIPIMPDPTCTQVRVRDASATISMSRSTFQLGAPEVEPVVEGLIDPLWIAICKPAQPSKSKLRFVKFEAGDTLCLQDESAYRAFVLLSGQVRVERNGMVIAREHREGTFLGETAALTGEPRMATIRADGPVWALVFNAAELEEFVMANPAAGIRLIKTLAVRNRVNSNSTCSDV